MYNDKIMGSCLSYSQMVLPNSFVQVPVGNKVRCIICMKRLHHNVVKCNKCNEELGHYYCFQLWHSINKRCPRCN